MATKSSLKVATSYPRKAVHAGLQAVSAVISLTSSLSAGDVLQFVKVPAGEVVVDVQWMAAGATGNAVVGNLGDGGDVDRCAVSNSVTVSGVIRATLGLPYSYSADDTVDLQITTATSASLVGALSMTVYYKMDDPNE